ncbi:phage tail tape measure protein [Romboutsia timonensis]|uniref:phage tail tape measure protein n=1 Tax=Romboutsia timonensis TaxID=1776391 RepID=UPI002A82626B|nr:phage tail tape measure protein [Romboutsia timonensis]MDY3960165.1 phage tail tape measure protein [Romboutsia timonensis]
MEFEQAMSKVKSTSGASADEIEQLSKHAEQLGKDIKGASANEIAKSYDYLALAGYKAKDMMTSMESVVKANIAFGGDMATTADLMTDSLSAMGKGAEDASHYLDVVAQTSRNANTSGIELMEAYIEVGGTLNNLGIELDESAKILAVMADNGLKGSEAGRSLQSVLVNLMGTTSTTKGALETLGVEVYDNEGKFRGLSTVLEEVVNSTSTMTDEQADMTLALLGGKTQLTALNNMLKSTDGSYDDLTEAIANSDGALEEMYLTMSDNTAGTFADLSSKLETVAKQFGDLLLPVLNQVVEAAIVVAEWIAGLSTEMKTTILAIGALIAAIGPLIIIIGALITNIGVIIATFGSLSTAIGTAGGLMPWFSATILPVIATIGSLIAIVVTLYMSIKENWEGIKEATNNLVENCKPYFEQLKEAFSNLWQTCQDICNTVIQPLFKIIGEVIAECIHFVSPILNSLMTIFSSVCNYISNYWNSIGKPVFSAIMSIVQTVWSVVQPIFNSISTLFSSIVNAISSVWNGIGMPIFKTIISIVGKVASAVTPAFNTFKNVIISAMNAVLSPIQFVIDKISTLLNWISNASSKVSSFVSSLNPFKSILGKSIDNGISMGDDAAVAPALSGSYYTADSIKSRNYVNSANKLASSIGNMSTSGISVNNNMDTSKLEELMMNMINLLTTQNTLIQANKPVFNLDGQQLSNKLDKISGENMRLYERFNV